MIGQARSSKPLGNRQPENHPVGFSRRVCLAVAREVDGVPTISLILFPRPRKDANGHANTTPAGNSPRDSCEIELRPRGGPTLPPRRINTCLSGTGGSDHYTKNAWIKTSVASAHADYELSALILTNHCVENSGTLRALSAQGNRPSCINSPLNRRRLWARDSIDSRAVC